jgi:hypothetical protein
MTKSFMVGSDPFDVTPFERGLCPRTPILGEASEGAVEGPSDGWASTS